MINLLMADDDTDDISLFEEAITTSSYPVNIISVHDGNKLIEKLHADKPDIIVIDINMPLKDGTECIVEIRSNDRYKNIPIVVFSSSDYNIKIQQCLKAGADHYLIKPSTFDGLLKMAHFIYNIASDYKHQTIVNSTQK